MALWFTADQHISHASIIEHCDRPFSSLEEMDRTIIANFNAMVRPNDDVWHLGDFTWRHNLEVVAKLWKRLNGRHKLIVGNHDHRWVKKWLKSFGHEAHGVQIYVENLLEIKYNKQRIVLCHYPLSSWNAKSHGSWHLHGHRHGGYQPEYGLILDVGVDSNNFLPISFEQVAKYMATRIPYLDKKDV